MPRMATLRELLAGPEPLLAPGAYDALSARLVERAGFPAVYMTSFGASASLLGRPDVGLLSFAEMAGHARRLAQAVAVPVIADGTPAALDLPDFDAFTTMIGLPEVRELEARFAVD